MTNHQHHEPRAIAAAQYALAIRSKRNVLQTLFYATLNNADESWAFYRRLTTLEEARADGMVAVAPGNIMPRMEVIDSKSGAEATAQDSALAFMIIADYSLQRFRTAIADTNIDTRRIGAVVRNDVMLNAAIWAFANQARHLHAWEQRQAAQLEAQEEVQIIRQLAYSPLDPNAAREFLCVGFRVPAYADFEDLLLQTAHAVIEGSGSRLAMVSAGAFLLDVDRQA